MNVLGVSHDVHPVVRVPVGPDDPRRLRDGRLHLLDALRQRPVPARRDQGVDSLDTRHDPRLEDIPEDVQREQRATWA